MPDDALAAGVGVPPDENQDLVSALHKERGDARWHTQTVVGGGDVPPDQRGDCVRACITSILGLPLDAIENIHGDNWWDRLLAEVARFGYTLALLDMKMEPPRSYWIATVPSLTLGADPDGEAALHTVVAKGYELAHDPGMKRKYTADEWAAAWNDGKVVEGWALVPVDAALASEASAAEGRKPNPPAGVGVARPAEWRASENSEKTPSVGAPSLRPEPDVAAPLADDGFGSELCAQCERDGGLPCAECGVLAYPPNYECGCEL